MKRILKASAAFALATTLIFAGAGMASATEEVSPTPEVSAEVQAPAETSPVEEAVVSEEVPAPAPAEAVETPEVPAAPADTESAPATDDAQPQAPPFEAYEVCATWETTSVNQTWPQTILSKDCAYTPEQRCEPYKIQFDKYWIRDEADKAYFDSLTGLNSAEDDQSLEPHDYYVTTIEAKDCTPSPANPTASLSAVCGAATVILTNPLINDANQITASFVVNVDGEFYEAYAVEAGNREELSIPFGEDTGTHKVEVFQAGTSEWKMIGSVDVPSDCVTPPVVVPPTEEPPVVVPPVVTPPVVTETPKPTPAPETGSLAATGGELPVILTVGAVLALVIGGAAIYLSRRKKVDEVTESVDAE